MNKVLELSVGKLFRYKNADARLRGQELFLLEWDRSGYMLIVALPSMTQKEAEIVKRNKVQVNALVKGAFVLPFWRFAASNLYGETPFDPTAYRSSLPESIREIPQTNLITIVGLDSTSMIIRVLRVANLPAAWLQRVVPAWEPAWEDPAYSSRYGAWLDRLATLPLDEIAQRAERLGYLGEDKRNKEGAASAKESQ